jgi:hypothetical protein
MTVSLHDHPASFDFAQDEEDRIGRLPMGAAAHKIDLTLSGAKRVEGRRMGLQRASAYREC